MKRDWRRIYISLAVLGLIVALTFAMAPFPEESSAMVQAPAPVKLPTELQYVPVDAALFLSVDTSLVWDIPIFKAIRKTDAKTFDDLANAVKMAFGLTPDDVRSVVVFVPKLQVGDDQNGLGVVVTFHNAYDREKLAKDSKLINCRI